MYFLLSLHVLPIYNLDSGLVCVFKFALTGLTRLTDERFKAFISANTEPGDAAKEGRPLFRCVLLVWLGYKLTQATDQSNSSLVNTLLPLVEVLSRVFSSRRGFSSVYPCVHFPMKMTATVCVWEVIGVHIEE